jgi:hypothetical protein
VEKFAFPGEPFKGNAFDGSTHQGYTNAFAQLWPDVQAALKAEVIEAQRKAAPRHVTFGGHSMGGSLVTMLSFAVSPGGGSSQKRCPFSWSFRSGSTRAGGG